MSWIFSHSGWLLHSSTHTATISHHTPSCFFPLTPWLLSSLGFLNQSASSGHWPWLLPLLGTHFLRLTPPTFLLPSRSCSPVTFFAGLAWTSRKIIIIITPHQLSLLYLISVYSQLLSPSDMLFVFLYLLIFSLKHRIIRGRLCGSGVEHLPSAQLRVWTQSSVLGSSSTSGSLREACFSLYLRLCLLSVSFMNK